MEERPMGIGQKLWGVLVAPGETFKAIGEDPKILIPALILIGINLVLALVVFPETKEMLLSTYKNMSNLPEGIDINKLVSQAQIGVIAATVFLPPLTWLIQAALLALFNAFSVGQAKFKQLYAVAVFAYTPAMVGGILQTILVKIMGAESITKIKLSLGLLLPPDITSGFWYNLLNTMNIFTIWGLILLVIGAAIVIGKDAKKIGAFLGLLWLAYICVMSYVATLNPAAAGM